MDNYASVVQQMEAFGVEFTPRDLPLQIPTPKRKTCGKKGKWWYWLQEFRPRAGGCYIVGKFGCYKHGGSEAKVEIDWKPLSDAERERFQKEQRAAADLARREKEEGAALAALSAGELWRRLSVRGASPYLDRKGVAPEACRFVTDWMRLGRRDANAKPISLPPGTLAVPLLRYDKDRDSALRGLQFIKPDGFKIFTEGFGKNGCSVRLGEIDEWTEILLACEGYATGLSIRMAVDRQHPVFVCLDAYNLATVVPMLRERYPSAFILMCADDDWKTADHQGANPGRSAARRVAKATARCEIVWPVFAPATRQDKDTDFNDLHQRQGLEAVERQLRAVLRAMKELGRVSA